MQGRERWLAVAAGTLAGLWLLDAVVLSPMTAWYRSLQEEVRATARTVAEGRILVDRAPRITAEWRSEHAAGLLDDEDAARFRLQQCLAASARSSGVTLDSVGGGQRIPAVRAGAYDTIRCSVTGQGTLAEVQGLLAALEDAAQPLRIERCELAARDGRKDQLDVALTLSTRIAATAARATRPAAAQAAPWTVPPRDRAVDAALLAARPFLANRRSDAAVEAPVRATAAPLAKAGAGLVGIVTGTGVARAFVRDGDGSERIIAVGDTLDQRAVQAIDERGLSLGGSATEARIIAVGSDLLGRPLETAVRTSAPVPPRPSGPSQPGAIPAPPATAAAIAPPAGADAEREAVLQRLREQRNRSR